MNQSPPTVAVIIPTYNRAHFIGQAIGSVLNQTRPPDEVIVVDDGSTDGTAAAVQAFGERVRYTRKENAGKPVALNHVMPEVESEYIWLMDDDDVALPNALATHLAFLAKHTDIDFSYGAYYSFSGNHPPNMNSLSSDAIAAAAPDGLFVRAMVHYPFYLQAALVPRRCYEAVGPFDESLTFGEDYEMILRLARRFRGGNVGAPTFCLRIHSGLRGPAHERRAASDRDKAFSDYDHRIFARLHATLPLAEYLPCRTEAGALNSMELRQARLQRACIMSRHGLFEQAFEDLRTVLDENSALLNGRERNILAQMVGVEASWLRMHPGYAASLGRLLRQRHANAALAACATGLGWRLESSIRGRRYGDAMLIAAHLHHLVGTVRLPALITMALVRRYRIAGPRQEDALPD